MSDRNHVTDFIAGEVFCNIEDYFPQIWKSPTGGWAVTARLPKELHEKWIRRVLGNKSFREKVVRLIAEVVQPMFDFPGDFLRVEWSPRGTHFSVHGSACTIYVERNHEQYSCHNVDSHHQSMLLFTAVAIYLKELYFALDYVIKEDSRGSVNEETWPELEGDGFSQIIEPLPEG